MNELLIDTHIITNYNNVQSTSVESTIGIDDELDSLEEAFDTINVNSTEYICLVGFIYDHQLYREYENKLRGKKIIFVSDVGKLPLQFLTVRDDQQHLSLLHQLVIIFEKLGKSMEPKVNKKAYELSDVYSFKCLDYNVVEKYLDEYDELYLDILANKCYTNGDMYMLYELVPEYKLPLAYYLLKDKKKGIVIIGSQTRSNNDILTFYVKGYDTKEIANLFGVELKVDTNVFSTFISSHINILGNNISKFLELERN